MDFTTCRRKERFQKNETQENQSFSASYYYPTSRAGLSLDVSWLDTFSVFGGIYCKLCWILQIAQILTITLHGAYRRAQI